MNNEFQEFGDTLAKMQANTKAIFDRACAYRSFAKACVIALQDAGFSRTAISRMSASAGLSQQDIQDLYA